MRPLLLRLSYAADKHSSTIAYAYSMLSLLKSQMRNLLAEPKKAGSSEASLSTEVLDL